MIPGHPNVTLSQIVADLETLGIRPGDDVLAHTSLSSLGWVEGGARTVVEAIVTAVGSEGTALFPAHTGHAAISPDNPPVFDVRTAPTLGIGAIPEAARLWPGAVRSLQPTHSVTAIGARAKFYTEGHELCATPCGEGSPYHRLASRGGRILLLGCDHGSNTSLHGVEEAAGVRYHMLPGVGMMRITDAEGHERSLAGRFHRWGVPRDFMRLDAEMTARGIQRIGRVAAATARLVEAGPMWNFVLERLREDPAILLPEGYTLPPELA